MSVGPNIRDGITASLLQTAEPVRVVAVDPGRLGVLSHELTSEHDARLADLFGDVGDDDRIVLRVVYALDRQRRYLTLECAVDGRRFPQVSEFDPAAFVEESEIYEQYGVFPDHGKRLNRVLMPPHRAATFPRLADGRAFTPARDYEPHVVSGEAFEFPFGPVRAAGWESLYTGLVTTGEEVLDVYLFHWHKHRGVERRLTGLSPGRAAFLVERADGLSSLGNTLAFCRAVEAATAVQAPEPAAHARTVALELERLYNHAAAVAAMCQTTGLAVGQARTELVLERLLRCNLAAFGHRYLFGVVRPGGVARGPDAQAIRAELGGILDEFRYLTAALLTTNSHVDRLEATGIVSAQDAERLALVGPVARASGQRIDVRADHAWGPGDEVLPRVASADAGDALARMQVMLEEVDEAAKLIEANLDVAGSGLADIPVAGGTGLGWAESPRGEALAWVSLDERGCVRRARLRPASLRNWRAFDDAARAQNVFTDIPIIEASFWLTVAGFAR